MARPSAAVPAVLRATAEEERIAAEAEQAASARLFTPDELARLGELPSLELAALPPAKRAGLQKLEGLLAQIRPTIRGKPAEYVRAEGGGAEAAATFALQDTARLSFTADGLVAYEWEKRARKTSTWLTRHYDAAGNTLRRTPAQPRQDFVAQEQARIEKREQARVLAELSQTERSVVPGIGPLARTVGEMPAATSPALYLQRGGSPLAAQLQQVFDGLRSEFQAFEASQKGQPGAPAERAALVQAFADKLLDADLSVRLQQGEQEIAQMETAVAQLEAGRPDLEARKRGLQTESATLGAQMKPRGLSRAAREAIRAQKQTIDAQLQEARGALMALDGQIQALKRQLRQKQRDLKPLVDRRSRFRSDLAFVLDPNQKTDKMAAASVGSLCNVLSYFLYGQAVGSIPPDKPFSEYYLEEFKKSNIGRQGGGIYYGYGSYDWRAHSGLHLYDKKASETGELISLGDPRRAGELREVLASDANLAISHQDLNNTPPKQPHHFLLIIRDAGGTWRNMDHTSSSLRRRGGETDWTRVFGLAADEAAIEQARAQLKVLEEQKALESAGVVPEAQAELSR